MKLSDQWAAASLRPVSGDYTRRRADSAAVTLAVRRVTRFWPGVTLFTRHVTLFGRRVTLHVTPALDNQCIPFNEVVP
jgi:hypothetical protein